jgi:hypothetical protein
VSLSEDDGVPVSVIDDAAGIERTNTGTGGTDGPPVAHAPSAAATEWKGCRRCGAAMCFNEACDFEARRREREDARRKADAAMGAAIKADPVGIFDVTFAKWPKKTDRDMALAAWREVWTDARCSDEAFIRAFGNGIDGWRRYWKEEETEVRYIPKFANWLKDEKWTIDPREVVR